MREHGDIPTAFEGVAPGATGVPASVVFASGSADRRIGARLPSQANREGPLREPDSVAP